MVEVFAQDTGGGDVVVGIGGRSVEDRHETVTEKVVDGPPIGGEREFFIAVEGANDTEFGIDGGADEVGVGEEML